jgi:hypothetical protein
VTEEEEEKNYDNGDGNDKERNIISTVHILI